MKPYTRDELEKLSLRNDLWLIAKALKIKKISNIKKDVLITFILKYRRLPIKFLDIDKLIKKKTIRDYFEKEGASATQELEFFFNKNEDKKNKLKYLKFKFDSEYISYEMKVKHQTNIIRNFLNSADDKINLLRDLRPMGKALNIKNFSTINKKELIEEIIKFEREEAFPIGLKSLRRFILSSAEFKKFLIILV